MNADYKILLLLQITVSKPVGSQAEQSIIEVSLLTGFVPVETTLEDIAVADVVDGTGMYLFQICFDDIYG